MLSLVIFLALLVTVLSELFQSPVFEVYLLSKSAVLLCQGLKLFTQNLKGRQFELNRLLLCLTGLQISV